MTTDKPNNHYVISWILGVVMFMEYFDSSALNLIFPDLAITFQIEPIFMKISLTSYLIAESIFIPVCGHLSHRFNLKTILQTGVILMGIGGVGCILSENISSLIFFRSIQGISAAFIAPTCRLLIIKKFEKDMRLDAINLVMGIALIGLVAGPISSAILVNIYNWKYVFYFMISLSVINLLLLSYFLPDYKELHKDRFDWVGYIIMISILISSYLFFDFSIKNNILSIFSLVWLIISVLFIFLYLIWAKINPDSIVPKSLLKNKQFRLGISSNFLFRILFGGMLFICSFSLQVQLGYSIVKTALYLSLYGLGMILGKFIVKTLVYILGYRKILILNSIVLFGLTICIMLEILTSSFYLLYITLFIYGVSATQQYSCMNIINLNDVERSLQSKANIALNTIRLLGTNFGISFCALLLGLSKIQNITMSAISLFIISFIGLFGAWQFRKVSLG